MHLVARTTSQSHGTSPDCLSQFTISHCTFKEVMCHVSIVCMMKTAHAHLNITQWPQSWFYIAYQNTATVYSFKQHLPVCPHSVQQSGYATSKVFKECLSCFLPTDDWTSGSWPRRHHDAVQWREPLDEQRWRHSNERGALWPNFSFFILFFSTFPVIWNARSNYLCCYLLEQVSLSCETCYLEQDRIWCVPVKKCACLGHCVVHTSMYHAVFGRIKGMGGGGGRGGGEASRAGLVVDALCFLWKCKAIY